MLRTLLCASLLSSFAATACKGKEKAPEPAATAAKAAKAATKDATATPEVAKVAVETPELPPVEPDLALIDATLETLGDATIAAAATKGLPAPQGDMGISCGGEEALMTALQAIGVASETLKGGKGFLFQDVCVGWRPYIKPATEMYWMISAGAPVEGLIPVRRCLQVLSANGAFSKADITDGPCLTMHRQE